MKQKLFTLLLAIVASVGTLFAWDYERVQIGDLYYNLDVSSQTAEVTRNPPEEIRGGFVIPSSVSYDALEYTVISIGNNAFSDCFGLTSIEIPNSVISIGDKAFYNCTSSSLASIEIPNSVTSIGSSAFSGCTGLTSMNIPNSVVSIGSSAFADCTGLTSVNLPNSVTEIREWTFSNCDGLTSITIPNSVRSIGSDAFSKCDALTSIVIPDGVTSIGSYAFENCSNLNSASISNSVTSIGEAAFGGCGSLTSIDVSTNNLTYCSIDGVVFSKDKTTLVQYPCGKQGAYTIPTSVICIGESAFEGSRLLTSITIPNSVTSISKSAFENCTGLTFVEIPNSVTSLGDHVFRGCSGMTFVKLSNNITSIGWRAFYKCSGLTFVTIPNSVEFIGSEAFYECTGLISITIPNSVTEIGNYAFAYCPGITSVTIGNSVTKIGQYAFYKCSSLTSLTIGNSVTEIGEGVFIDCTNLAVITCEAVNPPVLVPYYAFQNVNKSIPLYVLEGSVSAYHDAEGWKDFNNILPITAEKTEVTTPIIEPDVTSVYISWPIVEGATSYDLFMKDENGTPFCTYTFNAQGQLTAISSNAPARNNELQQLQSEGFAFTVTGLAPGTLYNYSIVAKNDLGATLNEETGSFTTNRLEAIGQIRQEPILNSQKLLINGQIYIRHSDRTYTLTGQEVK